jgi:hypothetical protein
MNSADPYFRFGCLIMSFVGVGLGPKAASVEELVDEENILGLRGWK